MNQATLRIWAVRVTYLSIALHLLIGALLPLIVNAPVFNDYHRGIETAFWGADVPDQVRAHQSWWIALFGPTVQAAAIWMGALAYIGDRQRSAFAWGALIAGVLLWAPQDIYISLQAGCWHNVWIDCLAVAGMLPPLFYLFHTDRAKATQQ